MQVKACITIVGASLFSIDVFAYEIDIHAQLTQEAFRLSRLFSADNATRNQLLNSQGLFSSRIRLQLLPDPGASRPIRGRSTDEVDLGSFYFDMSTNPPTRRTTYQYDYWYGYDQTRPVLRWDVVGSYNGVPAPMLADWLSRG